MAITPLEWEALRLSLLVSLTGIVVSLPFAIAMGWLLARLQFKGKSIVDGLVHLPLILPPVVVGYVLLLLLGRKGLLGAFLYDTLGITVAFTWKGAAVAAAVMAFPLVVRAIRQAVEAIDQGLEQAAQTLGAGRARVFFTITLPLMAPGILAGAILGFARALGEFGATITFVANIPGETRTLPLALYSVIQSPGGEVLALRLLVFSAVLAVIALAASQFLGNRMARRMEGGT